MSSKIFALNPSDKILIVGPREAYVQPFTAPSWTDLRIGMWLSLTKDSVDDDQSGLGETLTATTAADRIWIGLKNNNDDLPTVAGTSFAGLTSKSGTAAYLTNAEPSWNAARSDGVGQSLYANRYNGVTQINFTGGFPDIGVLATGLYLPLFLGDTNYATFFGMRFQSSGVITVPTSTLPVLATSATPTVTSLRTLLRNLSGWSATPACGTAPSPATDAIYFYWPFLNSRLRIHALVVEKFA